MISQTAEYALRAMVHLADQADRSLTTPQIAKVTKVPARYLAKVLGLLAKAGLVRSQRGLHGGFSLARVPQDISVLDVINAVDPIQRIHTCPLELKTHGKRLCPLHRRLDDALATIERAYGQSTLGDMLEDPSASRPLCDAVGTRKR